MEAEIKKLLQEDEEITDKFTSANFLREILKNADGRLTISEAESTSLHSLVAVCPASFCKRLKTVVKWCIFPLSPPV